MVSAPLLDETELDLLISFDIEDETKPSEAIVDAFLAADVDVYEKPTVLEDWIDTDIIDTLSWRSTGGPFYLSARVWNHRIVLTSGNVRIYGGTLTASENTFRIENLVH